MPFPVKVSAMNFNLSKQRVANILARSAMLVPPLEKLVAIGCRQPHLRRFGLGAVAHGYSRILTHSEFRIAKFDAYRLWVNVAEPLGIEPFFFGETCAAWLVPSLIGEGDVCVDGGANVGLYTFLMASLVGKGGRVFAFEANPEMLELLSRSVELNDYGSFVEVVPRALWNVADEELKFFVSPKDTGNSSLVDNGFVPQDHPIRVTTTTLDDFAHAHRLQRLRLVKLDVERAEDQVLRGTEHLLREQRIDYLIVELISNSEAARILQQYDYEGYRLNFQHHRLRPLADVAPGTFCDVLFVRPGLRDAFAQQFSQAITSSDCYW
jgi:FkbM family methyltransferase